MEVRPDLPIIREPPCPRAGGLRVTVTLPRTQSRKDCTMNREDPSIMELVCGTITIAALVCTLWVLAYIA